jgi:hypothetical protein
MKTARNTAKLNNLLINVKNFMRILILIVWKRSHMLPYDLFSYLFSPEIPDVEILRKYPMNLFPYKKKASINKIQRCKE